MHQQMQVLLRNQQALANAFDQNTNAFTQTLRHMEAMLLVSRRIMNDLARSEPLRFVGSEVDFDGYIREYYGCVGFIEFAVGLSALASRAGTITVPTGEEPIIFGGM